MKFKFYAITYKKDFTTYYFALPNSLYNFLKEINKEEYFYHIGIRYSLKDRKWHTDNFKINKEEYLFKEITEETETLKNVKDKLMQQFSKQQTKSLTEIRNLFRKEIYEDYKEESSCSLFIDEEDNLWFPLYLTLKNTNVFYSLTSYQNKIFSNNHCDITAKVVSMYEIIFNEDYKEKIEQYNKKFYDELINAFDNLERKRMPINKKSFLIIFAGYLKSKSILEEIEKAG